MVAERKMPDFEELKKQIMALAQTVQYGLPLSSLEKDFRDISDEGVDLQDVMKFYGYPSLEEMLTDMGDKVIILERQEGANIFGLPWPPKEPMPGRNEEEVRKRQQSVDYVKHLKSNDKELVIFPMHDQDQAVLQKLVRQQRTSMITRLGGAVPGISGQNRNGVRRTTSVIGSYRQQGMRTRRNSPSPQSRPSPPVDNGWAWSNGRRSASSNLKWDASTEEDPRRRNEGNTMQQRQPQLFNGTPPSPQLGPMNNACLGGTSNGGAGLRYPPQPLFRPTSETPPLDLKFGTLPPPKETPVFSIVAKYPSDSQPHKSFSTTNSRNILVDTGAEREVAPISARGQAENSVSLLDLDLPVAASTVPPLCAEPVSVSPEEIRKKVEEEEDYQRMREIENIILEMDDRFVEVPNLHGGISRVRPPSAELLREIQEGFARTRVQEQPQEQLQQREAVGFPARRHLINGAISRVSSPFLPNRFVSGINYWDGVYNILWNYAREPPEWIRLDTLCALYPLLMEDCILEGTLPKALVSEMNDYVSFDYDEFGFLWMHLRDPNDSAYPPVSLPLERLPRPVSETQLERMLLDYTVICLPSKRPQTQDSITAENWVEIRKKVYALVVEHFGLGMDSEQLVESYEIKYKEKLTHVIGGKSGLDLFMQEFQDLFIVCQKSPIHALVYPRLDVCPLPDSVLEKWDLKETYMMLNGNVF